MGRRLLDPLTELCYAWYTDSVTSTNDITSLQLHSLQGFVLASALFRQLQGTLCKAVSVVGIDVNALRSRIHLQASLPFAPGLGPRKAKVGRTQA